MSRAASVADFRQTAKTKLPKLLFDYADGGSYAEHTLQHNVEDFGRLLLRQRVMRDVSQLNLETELFGSTLDMPLILAPVGMGGMFARRGEAQAARAAATANIPLCLSTMSICGLDEVVAAGKRPPWFQLYMMRDRECMRDLLAHAGDLGCPVLVFTVDLPVSGARYRDVRSGMYGTPAIADKIKLAWDGFSRPGWLWDVYMMGRPHRLGNIPSRGIIGAGISGYWDWIRDNFDPAVTWHDIEWVRQYWSGPIVIKGVLDRQDALDALQAGADGLVVSNHGGRQLDDVPSSIAALPAIADALGGRLKLLIDGGVRSGIDVLKALASGADACLVGRPWVYALATGGEAGVREMLSIMRNELKVALALTGCTDVRTAGRELLLAER